MAQGASSWLDSLPAGVKQKFEAIISNQNLIKGQIHQELDDLAAQQDEPFKSQYIQSKQAFDAAKGFMDKIHEGKMQNCSAQAQAADAQIASVRNDMSITRTEEYRRIKAIIDAQPASVRTELNANAPYQNGKRRRK
uniref:SXP/RAL-2 family protein Ani s 5-like cation-binding domain-containing protein n=1 Tax=Acrobeloides nanus TaxID=290746 RepID=A0A914EJQ7_9BILA